MRKNWFIGDTHFSHARTLELSRRPFTSVEEMDNVLIENWNSKISTDDIVYHIGDFGEYEISHKLNGEIHLLVGNYERNDLEQNKISISDLRNNFNFASVCTELETFAVAEGNEFSLVHEPSHRNIEKFTLFGHIHKLQTVKKNALNVGVDCHNFCPIDLETVLFYKNAIQNHYDSEVFSS